MQNLMTPYLDLNSPTYGYDEETFGGNTIHISGPTVPPPPPPPSEDDKK